MHNLSQSHAEPWIATYWAQLICHIILEFFLHFITGPAPALYCYCTLVLCPLHFITGPAPALYCYCTLVLCPLLIQIITGPAPALYCYCTLVLCPLLIQIIKELASKPIFQVPATSHFLFVGFYRHQQPVEQMRNYWSNNLKILNNHLHDKLEH